MWQTHPEENLGFQIFQMLKQQEQKKKILI